MIKNLEKKDIDCPCGCDNKATSLFGQIEFDGYKPYYDSIVLDHCDKQHMWVMLISRAWEGYETDCAAIIHSYLDSDGVHSFIKEQNDSPWKDQELKGVTVVSRDQVLQKEGTKDWLFEQWEYLKNNHQDISKYFSV